MANGIKIKYLSILFFLFFFSSCKINGSYDLAVQELEKINQTLLENDLKKNSSLDELNLSLLSSLITASQNLETLQKELELINIQIDEINTDLKILEKENNEITSETKNYLNYLNSLTETSKKFTRKLYESTFVWDKYLSNNIENHDNLNFSKDVNESIFVDSFVNPLEAFIE